MRYWTPHSYISNNFQDDSAFNIKQCALVVVFGCLDVGYLN